MSGRALASDGTADVTFPSGKCRPYRLDLFHVQSIQPAASRDFRANRTAAIRRGIRFIDSVAADPRYFAENSEDLLWCLYTMSIVPADPQLRVMAGRMARERE